MSLFIAVTIYKKSMSTLKLSKTGRHVPGRVLCAPTIPITQVLLQRADEVKESFVSLKKRLWVKTGEFSKARRRKAWERYNQ